MIQLMRSIDVPMIEVRTKTFVSTTPLIQSNPLVQLGINRKIHGYII